MAVAGFNIGTVEVGTGKPFFIAGPCVVESKEIAFAAAEEIVRVSEKYNVSFIYKSSYLKANRQSINSFATIGSAKALQILKDVKSEYNIPVLTDIHSSEEAVIAAETVDCLQIPAFLCRQTELISAAAKTGLALNIKKGQFMAPEGMNEAADKAKAAGGTKIMLTERGTTFGYHDLVVDFRSLIIMRQLGYPVVFDCTHSVQKPGAAGDSSGGSPEFVLPLARAAAVVGVDGIFLETHPDPSKAKCDKHSQLRLKLLDEIVERILEVWGF
ncbi:MAG: 3-deoxy-8-phosphooctulonate synthase [candidate division Zixibacteria bacterium]|nr:3-deoxy-8-phosphooctulonate synthase [candidate division Zixibacteria bacterium]